MSKIDHFLREVPPKAPYLYVYDVARDGIYAT